MCAAVRRLALGDRHRHFAGKILPGQRIRVLHDLGRRALRHDLAAMHAGAGADVDDVIGQANRVLVMLDHDHGVAEVAQPLQRVEQPRIVALVQADRRLVQHVEHAGQARADLRGQADALALAAAQCAGGAREREIVQADVEQERQPVADFLQDADGDLVALRVERLRHGLEPFAGALHRHFGDFADMLAGDLDRQRFGLQAMAVAGRAGHVGEILGHLLARPFALGLTVAALEIGDDALERFLRVVGAQAVVVGELDLLVAGAVQERRLRLLRQVLPLVSSGTCRICRAQSASGYNRARTISPRARSRPCARSAPCRERPGPRRYAARPRPPQAGQAPKGLLNENSRGSISGMVKPETGQANFSENTMRSGPPCCGSLRSSCRTSSLPPHQPARRRIRPRRGRRRVQRGLKAFGEPLADVGAHHDAVDHHVDVVLEFLVERGASEIS